MKTIKIKTTKKYAKELILMLCILLFSLFLIPTAYAVGVTSYYYADNPLVMNAGDTKEIYLELQNMVGDQNVFFKAVLINGSEIAKIIDKNDIYEVPLGRKDVKVNLKVNIPKDATAGDKFNIGISFTTLSTEAPGQLRFGQSIEKYFDVIVAKPPKESKSAALSSPALYIILGIIAILIIIFLIKRKRNQ